MKKLAHGIYSYLFLGEAPTSICYFFHPSIHLYVCLPICRTPYLRNGTLSNHNFWCTCVKWWYLQTFFHFFEILIFWAVRRIKGQKIARNEKWQLHVSHAISQEQLVYDHDFWYTCVKWWYIQWFFFIFLKLKFWNWWAVRV